MYIIFYDYCKNNVFIIYEYIFINIVVVFLIILIIFLWGKNKVFNVLIL